MRHQDAAEGAEMEVAQREWLELEGCQSLSSSRKPLQAVGRAVLLLLKEPAHESLLRQKSFVFRSHPPFFAPPPPSPPSISLSSTLRGSSFSPADGVSAKTGRRMKGEGWTGRQSWKMKAMKQNVLDRRLEEAARKRARAQDETRGYKLHQL